jgi:ABC-type transporter Mla MlaB component
MLASPAQPLLLVLELFIVPRACAMLRITVHKTPEVVTFRLEGKLTGEWVDVLQECWQIALSRQQGTIRRADLTVFRVDLTGVTSIDAVGKACLAAMHRQGAELVAADCLTKAIVAEIIEAIR